MSLRCFFIVLSLVTSKVSLAQNLIITEIFADPTPSRGLPEREFIEIYNNSGENISLKGYTLTYGSTSSAFPDSILKSYEYAIVCRNIYAEELKPFGKVIGISNLSLNNNGATLRLLNPEKEEIHYVSYTFDWYTNGRNDGFSLEMIDLSYPCVGKDNWGSSEATVGATPGKTNSVSKQITVPELSVTGSGFEKNHIYLAFNKVLSSSFANNTNHFEIIKGSNEITKVEFSDEQRQSVKIELDSDISQTIELMVYDPEDCLGNIVDDIRLSFVDLPAPLPGEIQISEILFNPKTGGEDFVEIFNTSSQSFNLKNWKLAHRNSQGNMASIRNLFTLDHIIPPFTYLAFTTNKTFLEENYPFSGNIVEVAALPSYNNDQGTVFLLRPDSTVFDEFSYSEKMHAPLVNNADGVSLEKVSFRKNQNRWASASSDVKYATPGSQNSQAENDFLEQYFVAEPLVFNPYQTSDKPETKLSYKLSQEAQNASIIIVDKHGRKVKTLGNNLLLGTSGHIAWNGTDDYGNVLPVGYYVFVIDVYSTHNAQKFFAKTVLGSY